MEIPISIAFVLFLIPWMYKYKRNDYTRFADPAFLFFGMQIFVSFLAGCLRITSVLTPAIDFSLESFLFMYLLSFAFFFGVETDFLLKKKVKNGKAYSPKKAKNNIYRIGFYISAIVGIFGTVLLLKGMGFSNIIVALTSYISDFNYFDALFFNNSAAILWQANISALFWYSYSRRRIIDKILITLNIMGVMLRAAYLYVVVAFFYFIVPLLIMRGSNQSKSPIIIVTIIAIFIIILPFMSYNFDENHLLRYLEKVYPYTYGNYVNYNYNFHNNKINLIISSNSITENVNLLGFGSILFYFDKYLSNSITSSNETMDGDGFNLLTKETKVKGNTSTIFSSFIRLPLFVSLIYFYFLGIINRIIFNKAKLSIFFLAVYSWFSAANFLSFATGGHFATTRFFPSLLYVMPFILVVLLTKKRNYFVS